MLVSVLLLPSCLGSDDDATYYDDVAITSFTLGTMTRTVTITKSTGVDTTYNVSYSGSSYKICIDQMGYRIFNSDSLLMGTDLKHVVCTLTTRNSAVVAVKSLTSDSLLTYSSTDSIDFSQPRTFRIISTDGDHYRDYTVTLSVRQREAGVLIWSAADAAQMPESADMVADSIDMQQLDDDASLVPQLSLAGVAWMGTNDMRYDLWAGLRTETDKAMTIWRKLSDADHAGRWVYMTQAEDNPFYLPAMEQVALVYYSGRLLALGSKGVIYQSTDQGITWKQNSDISMPEGFGGAPLKAIVSNGYLWLKDGQGQVWRGYLTK